MGKKFLVNLGLILSFYGCGTTEFTAKDKNSSSDGTNPSNSGDANRGETGSHKPGANNNEQTGGSNGPGTNGHIDSSFHLALDWQWQCKNLNVPSTTAQDSKKLTGGGDHKINLTSHPIDFTLDIHGDFCKPSDRLRDIILIVDTSGSMFDMDPTLPDGGCERKNAAKKLIDSLKGSKTAKIGLITFNTRVGFNSKSLLSPDDFAVQYLTNENFCHSFGLTSYDLALNAAGEMFTNFSRQNANKEVFFLTDGAPTDELASEIAAEKLKKSAFIATIMLGDVEDTHLRNIVASKDKDGNPIHEVANNASVLAEKFAKLSQSKIEKATLRYKSLNAGAQWNTIDLFKNGNQEKFQIPKLKLKFADFNKGVVVDYKYEDSFGSQIEDLGTVLWNSN